MSPASQCAVAGLLLFSAVPTHGSRDKFYRPVHASTSAKELIANITVSPQGKLVQTATNTSGFNASIHEYTLHEPAHKAFEIEADAAHANETVTVDGNSSTSGNAFATENLHGTNKDIVIRAVNGVPPSPPPPPTYTCNNSTYKCVQQKPGEKGGETRPVCKAACKKPEALPEVHVATKQLSARVQDKADRSALDAEDETYTIHIIADPEPDPEPEPEPEPKPAPKPPMGVKYCCSGKNCGNPDIIKEMSLKFSSTASAVDITFQGAQDTKQTTCQAEPISYDADTGVVTFSHIGDPEDCLNQILVHATVVPPFNNKVYTTFSSRDNTVQIAIHGLDTPVLLSKCGHAPKPPPTPTPTPSSGNNNGIPPTTIAIIVVVSFVVAIAGCLVCRRLAVQRENDKSEPSLP